MPTSVLFTGGGSAGHVTPNIALIEAVRERGWNVQYVGSAKGIEKEIIGQLEVPYHAVSSGKLRRYFSWQNFVDPFRILLGVLQAFLLLGRLRPAILFSKGGFVSVPVVFAAWLRRIPVICHESDVTPGLANRLSYPFARRICITFEASARYLTGSKVLLTGTPVRGSILKGNAEAGLAYLNVSDDKPVLLVFGGSLGAGVINEAVRDALPELLARFNVIHVVGAGQIVESINLTGYQQREFIGEDFGDVLAAATLVVSRAGANSLYELFIAGKPHLLIPLGIAASRGDQIDNARTFESAGYSRVLFEEALGPASLVQGIDQLYEDRESLKNAMQKFDVKDSVSLILSEIEQHLR